MIQSYHLVWLAANPDRTEAWLAGKLAEGFHVHHIDGDHSNDDPGNLVLIWGIDHLMIHSGKRPRIRHKPPIPRQPKPAAPSRAARAEAKRAARRAEVIRMAGFDIYGQYRQDD